MAWKRRLSTDFCDYVAIHPEMWPTEDAVRTWDKRREGSGLRRGSCSSLPSGRPQNPRIIALIINYLRQSNTSPVVKQQLEALYGFLRMHRSIPNPAELDPLEIIESICEQPISTTDMIATGMAMVITVIEHVRNPAKGIRPCRPEELPIVVPWLYTTLGHEISTVPISNSAASQLVKDRVGIGEDEYQEHARKWLTEIPWSVVVVEGRDPKDLEAVSVALPLKWPAYQQIRCGNLRPYDCGPDEMVCPAEQLFVESLAMRPRFDGKPRVGHNAPLARALLCQHAHLTDIEGIGRTRTMRLLTRCLTPRHRVWLKRFRYRLVEGLEGKFPYELHERVVQVLKSDPLTWADLPYLVVWNLFQVLTRKQVGDDATSDSFAETLPPLL